MGQTAIGIDIGGTHLRAGRIAEDGAILARSRVASSRDASDVLERLIALIAELDDPTVVAIGVGVPGRVDFARREVLSGGYVDLSSAPGGGADRGQIRASGDNRQRREHGDGGRGAVRGWTRGATACASDHWHRHRRRHSCGRPHPPGSRNGRTARPHPGGSERSALPLRPARLPGADELRHGARRPDPERGPAARHDGRDADRAVPVWRQPGAPHPDDLGGAIAPGDQIPSLRRSTANG